MDHDRPLIFQIGFNKCATSALFRLFNRSGYKTIHSGGRFWRVKKHPSIVGRNIQKEIRHNIEEGRPPLEGFEDFHVFLDMEYTHSSAVIENYRDFAIFARAYPHAKFILNTRNKDAWLRSRSRHHDGVYMDLAKRRFNVDENGVRSFWASDFDRHHEAVRRYFAPEPHRLLEFNIDTTPIDDLADFVAPEMALDLTLWKKVRVTDDVARKNGWEKPAPVQFAQAG